MVTESVTQFRLLPREAKFFGGIFCDDPPANVLLRMTSLDVFAKLLAGIVVVTAEVTAVVMFRRHILFTTAIPMNSSGHIEYRFDLRLSGRRHRNDPDGGRTRAIIDIDRPP